jgi:uncharacterized protein (DUF885 family)
MNRNGTNGKYLMLLVAGMALASCSRSPEEIPAGDVDRVADVNGIADEFLSAYYAQFPEEVYEVGYPDAPTDRFGDHSADALTRWYAAVEGWLRKLDEIPVASLAGKPEALTYVFTRERLQAIADRRICRMEFWNVSPTWTGWQSSVIATLAVQPVATAEERNAALARARDIARFVRTEIANLSRGMDEGYLAPASNVTAVLAQMDALLETPLEESPFMSPAERADDAAFAAEYRDVIESGVLPAVASYRDFLARDYAGRERIGVGANPDGEACYRASVRYWSSLAMEPEDIHRSGLSEMARIQTAMLSIAESAFDTRDLEALFVRLRSEPEFTFESEEQMLAYVNAAVQRGHEAVPQWFGDVPDAELIVVPSPAYEQDSGGGFYSAGAADGSRPGKYQVGTHNPRGISRAGTEATAFHESWPGHHLQISVALLNEDLPPILRYMFVSGSVEGWGLYAERLADEMGLYSSELSRLGMLSNEAYRAARLVVDPGIHVLGWTRDEAIEYMLAHTAEGHESISSEIDRYAAVPGQATSYLVGSLEIQRLRRHAEAALGESFDIREFHDQVLANGGITLPMLAARIDAWIEETLERLPAAT